MPDYGRELQFGVFPVPAAASLDEILAIVSTADRAGLDLIGVQDHPYQRRFLDTMALIAFLSARTDRVTFFPDVACLPLRPPAVLAKMAAAIDLLSGGRFELGLGAGAFWDAIEGYGGERRTPGDALTALEEAMHIVRLVWSGDRSLAFDGDHYRLKGVHGGPTPAHPIEIWLGVGGPKALQLVGRLADGWVPSIPRTPVGDLPAKSEIIDQAARGAGRDPGDIRRVANVNGMITDGESKGFLHGPPIQWIEELTDLAVTHGFDSFVLWSEEDPVEQTGKFAELAPAVQESVAQARK